MDNCPYDQIPIKRNAPTIKCPSCGRIYHKECWVENGNKCCILGCQGQKVQKSVDPWKWFSGILALFIILGSGYNFIFKKSEVISQVNSPGTQISEPVLPILTKVITLTEMPTTTIGYTLTKTFRRTPTIIPSQTKTSQTPTKINTTTQQKPVIKDFFACRTPCNQNGSNSQSSFPEKIEKIYLYWIYENFPKNAKYERKWTFYNDIWVRYRCQWTGSSSGIEDSITLTEPAGLRSGTWVITITLNGETLLQESIFIRGDWNYWDPAGEFDVCYGKR